MIKLGQKIEFDPWQGLNGILGCREGVTTVGTVVYINNDHHWFTVEYPLGKEKFRTCFHFVDVFGEKRYARLLRN